MLKKIFYGLFVLFLIGGINSCKKNKNDAPCSLAWATELSAEVNAMSAAAQAYASDPTTANCNAYKQATQAYLNALSPYGNCTLLSGQQRIAWENALADAQESVDNMDC
jgi:hypothetical protein